MSLGFEASLNESLDFLRRFHEASASTGLRFDVSKVGPTASATVLEVAAAADNGFTCLVHLTWAVFDLTALTAGYAIKILTLGYAGGLAHRHDNLNHARGCLSSAAKVVGLAGGTVSTATVGFFSPQTNYAWHQRFGLVTSKSLLQEQSDAEKIKQLGDDLTAAQTELKAAQEASAAAEEKNQKYLEEHQSEEELQNQKMEELEGKIQEKDEELGSHRELIIQKNQAEHDLKKIKEENQKLNDAAKELAEQIQKNEAQNKSAIEELNVKLGEAVQVKQQLETANSELQTKVRTAEENGNALQSIIQTLNSKLETFKTQLETDSTESKRRGAEVESLKKSLEETRTKLQTAEGDVLHLGEGGTRLKQEKAALEKEKEAARLAQEELAKENQALSAEITKVRQEKEVAEQRLSAEITKLNEEISKLQADQAKEKSGSGKFSFLWGKGDKTG